MNPWAVVDWLFAAPPMAISLDRVQLAEREERRASLDREHSGRDAQECFDRVSRRMRNGDKDWIPPMYSRAKAFKAWRKKHRRLVSGIEHIRRQA